MLRIKIILLFYRKLFVPAIIFSILIGFYSVFMQGGVTVVSFGMPYLFLPLLMQYFIYEIRYRNEYFFYHNLGLSKIFLWVSNLLISLLGAIIISIITWIVYRQIV